MSHSDEYCPHCDNHFLLEAKTPKPTLNVEGEDVRVNARMIKDDRTRNAQSRSLFGMKGTSGQLG